METFKCKKCGCNSFTTHKKANNLVANCADCGTYWKNLPQDEKVKLHFGKFKGVIIEQMKTPDELNYLRWLITTDIYNKMGVRYKEAIQKALR